MEYNDLDGYGESMLRNEIQKKLEKHFQNASAYASIKNLNALKKEFSEIEEIITKEFNQAEKNWTSLLWHLSGGELDTENRELLEDIKPNVELAYTSAERALRFYNVAFSKLLTIAERKDSCNDEGTYLAEAA